MECYYKEMFGLGLFVALIVYLALTLFWNQIERLLKRIQDVLNLR